MNRVDQVKYNSEYNPNQMLNMVRANLRLKNDAALSRKLEVGPPVISKVRHGRLPVGAALLIRIHEVTGLDIDELRRLLGDRRAKYRIGDPAGRAEARRVPGAA
jgi:transcriptional regulator with XRE-family HTH domain